MALGAEEGEELFADIVGGPRTRVGLLWHSANVTSRNGRQDRWASEEKSTIEHAPSA